MKIIESCKEMQDFANELIAGGKRIGFVPTMGALHEGHLSLIDLAREEDAVIVASIFVNPTQFGPSEDFDRYPRQAESDLEALRERKVDIVFIPKREDIFPEDYSTYLNEEGLSKGLCGISRPVFFRGVCTVVSILFNLVRPHFAVFGQKDAQQAAIIKKMVRDLRLQVEIKVGPTVRESDGLAMSSRNQYLSVGQRKDACVINQALRKAEKMVKEGNRNVDRISAEIIYMLSLHRNLRVIYVSIVDPDSMEPLREIVPGRTLIALAVWCNEVRLIDNILV